MCADDGQCPDNDQDDCVTRGVHGGDQADLSSRSLVANAVGEGEDNEGNDQAALDKPHDNIIVQSSTTHEAKRELSDLQENKELLIEGFEQNTPLSTMVMEGSQTGTIGIVKEDGILEDSTGTTEGIDQEKTRRSTATETTVIINEDKEQVHRANKKTSVLATLNEEINITICESTETEIQREEDVDGEVHMSKLEQGQNRVDEAVAAKETLNMGLDNKADVEMTALDHGSRTDGHALVTTRASNLDHGSRTDGHALETTRASNLDVESINLVDKEEESGNGKETANGEIQLFNKHANLTITTTPYMWECNLHVDDHNSMVHCKGLPAMHLLS